MTRHPFGSRLAVAVVATALVVVGAYTGSSGATGAKTKPKPAIPGASKGNAPGVSGETVKFAVLTQTKDCGANKAPANLKGTEERYTTYVNWFNEHLRFPGGRKLEVEFIDSGGVDAACADVQRANVLKAIQQDHVFAIIGPSNNPGVNIADIIAKNKTISIGGFTFQTFHDLKSHAPYAWSLTEPGELSFQELTWFIQKRFKGTQYTTDDGAKKARVWGMLFIDNTLNHVLANLTKKQMTKAGINTRQYFISTNNATAAQQASGIALQMQQDGVNSLIYGFSATAPFLAFNTAAKNASYHPDFFISQYGTLPQLTVFVPLFGPEFVKRLYGVGPPLIEQERVELDPSGDITPTSCPSCYGQVNNEQVAYTDAYVQAGGQDGRHPEIGANGVPTDIWPGMATLATGIAEAGPVLNAYTFSWGLQHGKTAACMTSRFYGVQPYKQSQIWGYDNPPRNYLQSGYTSLYFNPTAKTKYGSTGLFESYDNYERFDGLNDLPAKPTYDTGPKGGYKLIHQRSHINVAYDCQAKAGR
jgi:hypothetical protein